MRIIFIPPEDSFEYQIQGIKCFMFRSFRWISGVLGFKMIILKLNKLNFKNGFSKLKKKIAFFVIPCLNFWRKYQLIWLSLDKRGVARNFKDA